MLTLVTMPSATTTLAEVGSWASPIFTDLLPFMYLAVGFFLAFYLVHFIIKAIKK